jgi:nucleoside-diphosphate-sugar epimerase
MDMMLLGQRVFVTGASGFIGRHLVRTLVGRGAEVHVLSRSLPPRGDRPVTTYLGDLTDQESIRAALAASNPSIVFHLAAYGARPGERDRHRMFDVNVTGAINLWQGLTESVRRVVMAGTAREHATATAPVAESYPCEPTHSYPATKHAAVTLLKAMANEDGRSFVSLRLYGPYGPGDDSDRVLPFTIRRLLAGAEVPLTDGEQLYDFAYVDDHVDALLRAALGTLPKPVVTYNIGGGTPLRLRSVLEAMADAIGGHARSLLKFGAVQRRVGDTATLCADIAAARRDLGYAPTVPLEEGLRRTVEWHRVQLGHPAHQ